MISLKKKTVILLTAISASSFILYQLYFFLALSSEKNFNGKIIPVLDHESVKQLIHVRSEHDKYINENGLLRGVYFNQVKDYRPDSKNEFKCRSSKQQIPFEYVNDDFCDCDDGTDEPSTNACPSGIFYCDTQYPKSSINSIPSGQVNDGICDCCDGSDEWILAGKQRLVRQNGPHNIRHYVTVCPNICTKSS
ncbi:unnamed protein product [Leptosia nina]|uniref:Glucosidase II beta subunit N-terminal domain-containing protein n=1 Tax=Leptosia nina TaxID=320188 RepID=A0AAV1J410_9NEOP